MTKDNTPSCCYRADLPCDRRSTCPIHKEIDRRALKARHLIFPYRVPRKWDPEGEPRWWSTLCGLHLHPRYGTEQFYIDIYKMFPEGDKQLRIASNLKMEMDLEGWNYAPSPSKDPRYEVFYQVGWGGREVVVSTSSATTCDRCRKIRAKRKLTIGRPCATYDVDEQALRLGRWKAESPQKA